MPVIEKLKLENFEAYRQAEIFFTDGLNLITGRNSSGKTTILDAIFFALYGEVPEVTKRLLVSRLPATDKSMTVQITFNSPITGQKVQIFRQGKLTGPKTFKTEKRRLLIDNVEVPVSSDVELKNKVSELIGVGMKKFLNLVYTRQGELTRILRPNRDEMDNILGINILKELIAEFEILEKEFTSYEGKDVETELANIRQIILPTLQPQLERLTKQTTQLEQEIAELEKKILTVKSAEFLNLIQKINERDNLINQLKQEETKIQFLLNKYSVSSPEKLKEKIAQLNLEQVQKQIEEINTKIELLTQLQRELQEKITAIKTILEKNQVSTISQLIQKQNQLQESLTKTNHELEMLNREMERIQLALTELQPELLKLKKDLTEHKAMLENKVGTCPTCKQPITAELLTKLIKQEEEKIRELEPKLQDLEATQEQLNSKKEKLKQQQTNLTTTLTSIKEDLAKIAELAKEATLSDLEKNLLEITQELASLQEEYKAKIEERSAIESEKEALLTASQEIEFAINKTTQLQTALFETIATIDTLLKKLTLPFKPEEKDLKSKVAEKLPFSPEEIEAAEEEIRKKKETLEKATEEIEKTRRKIEEYQQLEKKLATRLKQTQTIRSLKKRIEEIIEEIRNVTLQNIAKEALSIYNTLTDQQIYEKFEIDPENYRVYVYPHAFRTKLPATRTGGGHQTLIALSIKLALLRVLGYRNLLILDEPTYGVDAENITQLLARLAEAAQNITQVILVTHYGLGEEAAANIIHVKKQPDGSSVTIQ